MQPTPVALLQRWYSLVREKRPTRQDFLKSLVKVFQENPSYQSAQVCRAVPFLSLSVLMAGQDDVDFTRYMAENFAAFEYKTQEEVFTVVKYLTTVLSTTGMQLLEMISPSHLLTQLHEPPHPGAPPHDAMNTIPQTNSESEYAHLFLARTVLIVKLDVPTTTAPDRIPLMRTSVIIGMVMLLKAHLKTLYSLSEE